MTKQELDQRIDELKAQGHDVRTMGSADLYDNRIPTGVREVLGLDLVRRWSERRAAALAGK